MAPSTPARPTLLRTLNDRRVLEKLLDGGPSTRTALAVGTGLSKPTISEVMLRLESAGLVVVTGHESGRPGPRGILYDIPAPQWVGAAYSVTPRRVRACLQDVRGQELVRLDLPHRGLPREPAALVGAVNALLAAQAGVRAPVREVAVGIPGAYDPAADRIAHLDGLPAWKAPGIAAGIHEALGAGVLIDNDANLALLAARPPDAADPGVTCLLWMAEGVGLAISVAGDLFTGAAGRAGEIGYVPVAHAADRSHPLTLHDLIGSAGVHRLAVEFGVPGRDGEQALRRALASPRAPGSDPFLSELARRVATAVSVAMAVLAPSEVILGGTLGSVGGAELARRTEHALRHLTPLRTRVSHTAPSDGDPVLAGAARRCTTGLRAALLDQIHTD